MPKGISLGDWLLEGLGNADSVLCRKLPAFFRPPPGPKKRNTCFRSHEKPSSNCCFEDLLDGKGPSGRAIESGCLVPTGEGLNSFCPFLSSSPGLALQQEARQSVWGKALRGVQLRTDGGCKGEMEGEKYREVNITERAREKRCMKTKLR